MKKLIILMLSCFGFASIAVAQNDMASTGNSVEMADYERYFDKMLEMEYRISTIKALDMTSEEIEEFNPIFDQYLERKEKLAKKRVKLVEDLKEELAEDDSRKNENNDKADFIEDYLDLKVEDTKLRKKYFDEIQDEISLEKATKFLLWEDIMDDRMNKRTIVQIVPVPMEMQYMSYDYDIDRERMNKRNTKTNRKESMVSKGYNDTKMSKKYKTSNYAGKKAAVKVSAEDFNNWLASTDGEVDLSHDYTYNGISKLMNVLSVMEDNGALNVSYFDAEKKKIMDMAAKLKKNPMSDEHADIARKTFMTIANLMYNNSALTEAASEINADVLMTNQASSVKNFFKTANTQLQEMSMHDVQERREMNDRK